MPKHFSLKTTFWFFLLVFWASPALAQVDTAWVRRYDGPGHSEDIAQAIAVNDSGNIYVTGISGSECATIKYYPNGDTAWLRRYYDMPMHEVVGLGIDGRGNVYVAGWGDCDAVHHHSYLTLKYNSDGILKWSRRYYVADNAYTEAAAMTVDESGNVYLTGATADHLEDFDYSTIKYDSSGYLLWATSYDTGGSEDSPLAIAIDSYGNVYVTGRSGDRGPGDDYATIKYDPDGNEIWVRTYNGPANGRDIAWAITTDDSGSVYVTGYSNGDYATIKYYSNGDTAWVGRYNGAGNNADAASAITVDNSHNTYVTGRSVELNHDCTTVKYDSNGSELWVSRYNGPRNNVDEGRAIATDDSGNVYVAGYSAGGSTWPDSNDYVTIKYDSEGNELWVKRYDGPTKLRDEANAIAVDHSGNVYVTGGSIGEYWLGNSDFATIKYVSVPFIRGDVNADGTIDIGDIVYVINYVFYGGPAPVPLQAGDLNCDGVVDISDVVYLINYVFYNGPEPNCP